MFSGKVEQARRAEHLRRCAESPAYKRVYERWLTMNREHIQQIATILNADINQRNSQEVQPLSESVKSQFVKLKDRPDPIPPPEELQRIATCGNPWAWFILGLMCADEEKLKQMREDAVATQEMVEVNKKYDCEMICLSGFEC